MAVFTPQERDRLAKSIFSNLCSREYYDKTQGRWVTIKGAHVKIADDGKVLAGPPNLVKHVEDSGGFKLGQQKEKIGRGLGAEQQKFVETSKGKQANLFHGLNDKPGQNKLFGDMDLAGASAADLKPAPKNEPPAETPAWKGLAQSADEAAAAGKHDLAARRYQDAADNHPEPNGPEAQALRAKAAGKAVAEPEQPAAQVAEPEAAKKPTRTAARIANEARMHKAMADYYRGIADKQSPAEAKRLKGLADQHDKLHAEKTARSAKPTKPPAGPKPDKVSEIPPAPVTSSAPVPSGGSSSQTTDGIANDAPTLVGEDGKPKTVYHGSSTDFANFDNSKMGGDNLFGPGHYFTENQDVANSYAGVRSQLKPKVSAEEAHKLMLERAPKYRASVKDSNGMYNPVPLDSPGGKEFVSEMLKSGKKDKFDQLEKLSPGLGKALWDDQTKPTLKAAQLSISKPFDADKEKIPGEWLGKGYAHHGAKTFDEWTEAGPDGEPSIADAATVSKAIQQQGYDGLTHAGGGRYGDKSGPKHRVWVAFDANQIKQVNQPEAAGKPAENTATEPSKPETPAEAPKAVTSEPKKNLLHALQDKASPEAKEMPTAAAIARGDGPHRLKNQLGEKPPPGVTVGPGGIWQGSATLHAEDIQADPARFQYKVSGVGSKGVTKQLADVKRFNPMFGGQAMVWRDPADGKTYVINGHHRLELAQRSPHYEDEATGLQWKGEMQSYYIPAKTAAQARAMGALANMAAGHGTATDAAKFMRDTGLGVDSLKEQGISLKGKLAADAVALKDLSSRSFEDMVQGRLPESRAVAVAKHVKDPERQDSLLRKLAAREAAGRPVSDDAAEQAAKEVSLAGTTQERGGGLFGDLGEHSLEVERGEVKSAIRKAIASERNTFKAVSSAKRAGRLSESGNVLDVEGNRQRAEQADETLGMFDTLANSRSGVSKEIQEAAEKYYHEPSKRDEIIRGLVSRLPEIIERDWREFQGGSKSETYARRTEGVYRGSAIDAGAGSYRTRNNGAGPMASRSLFTLNERDALTLALRPAVEHYARGDREHYDGGQWDESKHKRGQPGNAGQFGPGGGSAKGPEAKAPSKPAAPGKSTGSQAPHGTSSADYTPAKAPQPQKAVRAEDLLKSLNSGAPPEQALTDNLAHASPAVRAVEREYPPANHNGNDTMERHRMPDGAFTPQRKALHDKIINSIVGKVPPSQDRTFYMMGGGPASGKSAILKSGQVTLPQAAHIDADAIKTQLPEYNALQGAKDMRAASFVHEESSGIGKTAMSQAFGAGQNVLLDGTGNASLEGVKSKADAARRAGYKVHAEYVTCSVDEAVRRNIERAKKTGRLPPEAFLRHTHKTVSQILPQAIAAGVFDHVRLWDTEHPDVDGKPSLVASGAGNQLTVHNQQLWDSFVAKGK